MKTKYEIHAPGSGSLPSHCERVAQYWSTLVCFDIWASGRAAAMKYKSARAFKKGLRDGGLSEEQVSQAFADTVELARLYKNTK